MELFARYQALAASSREESDVVAMGALNRTVRGDDGDDDVDYNKAREPATSCKDAIAKYGKETTSTSKEPQPLAVCFERWESIKTHLAPGMTGVRGADREFVSNPHIVSSQLDTKATVRNENTGRVSPPGERVDGIRC